MSESFMTYRRKMMPPQNSWVQLGSFDVTTKVQWIYLIYLSDVGTLCELFDTEIVRIGVLTTVKVLFIAALKQ